MFLVVLNSFFTVSVKIENARLKLEVTIPIGVPIAFANDETEMQPDKRNKTINVLLKQSKKSNVFANSFAH